MTNEERNLVMKDPTAVAKAAVVRELKNSINSDVISGTTSATISAAGGSKSWSKMSITERAKWYEFAKKDLNDYIHRHFGFEVRALPDIRHVRMVSGRNI